MKAMRQHSHGFAVNKVPDHIACWAAFSGLLDDGAIESADWAAKKKKPSASSAAVYDIAEFGKFAGSATMNSPAPNVPCNLTVAKAKAPKLPADYEPLDPVEPIKATYKGKGDDVDNYNDNDEEDMDDGSDSDGSGSGSQ